MIDPTNVIKYDRTDAELEEWALFSICVAGKTAKTQARLLDNFLKNISIEGDSPFDAIRRLSSEQLEEALKESRLGQYRRITKSFMEVVKFDLRNATVEMLETVHGIGPKTARMFVMHSRPNQRVAALDTHLLKFLKAEGYKVPITTPPSGKLYSKLEETFLKLADAAGMTPADFDLQIWKTYANS